MQFKKHLITVMKMYNFFFFCKIFFFEWNVKNYYRLIGK